MRKTNTALVAEVRMMPISSLIETTAWLRTEAMVESPAFQHLQDRPLRALEHEQDRRCIADPDTAHDIANRMVSSHRPGCGTDFRCPSREHLPTTFPRY